MKKNLKNSIMLFTERTGAVLSKIPISVTAVVAVTLSMILGMIANAKEMLLKTLTTTFTEYDFLKLSAYTILYITTYFVYRSFWKTFLMQNGNRLHQKWLKRVYKTNMIVIQKSSSAKLDKMIMEASNFANDIIAMIIDLIPSLIPAVVYFYTVTAHSVKVGVISIISCAIGVTLSVLNDKLFGWGENAARRKAKLHTITGDNYANIKTLKYMHKEEFAYDRLKNVQVDAIPVSINTAKFAYFRLCDICITFPLMYAIWSFRDLPEMRNYAITIFPVVCECIYTLINMAEIFVEYQDTIGELKDLDGNDVDKKEKCISEISLKNIEFSYGKKNEIFKVEDIKIPYGSKVMITGETGQGKSSFANLLAGVIPVDKGIMKQFDVFYVYQESDCLNDTLRNNLTFGDKSIDDETLLDLLHEANMDEWLEKNKDGLDTMLGERGCKLSSGQKQRINIIRTVLHWRQHNDMLTICDEITSNLDDTTRDLMIKFIEREYRGTCIFITHNEGFERICNQHIHVENHMFKEIPLQKIDVPIIVTNRTEPKAKKGGKNYVR